MFRDMGNSQGNRRLSVSDIHVMLQLSEVYSYRKVGKIMGVSAQWAAEIVGNASHYMLNNNLSTSILNLSSAFLPFVVELTA